MLTSFISLLVPILLLILPIQIIGLTTYFLGNRQLTIKQRMQNTRTHRLLFAINLFILLSYGISVLLRK